MREYLQKHREPLLYLVFGVLTTAVSYAAYLLLRAALPGLPKASLSAAADLIAILFAYLTNRRWVFRSRAAGRAAVLREMASFFGSRALTLLLGAGIVLVAADLMGWNDLLVKLAANGIVIVLNYLLSKFWVFRKKPDAVPEEIVDQTPDRIGE